MIRAIRSIGALALALVTELGRMAVFMLQGAVSMLTPPWRGRRLVHEVYDTGALSVAIVCGAGLAVGMVLGLQGYNTLSRFGAEESLGALIGLGLIRELGPVITGLLVTGRAGSAMAAEIGTMNATEQLDGLRMMSVDPMGYVVGPKAIAMLLAMPLLASLFILSAVGGGYLVGVKLLGVDGGVFFSSLQSAVTFRDDVAVSLIKEVVFGALLGLIATYRGFHCRRSAAGVSAATTSTVVIGSVAILVADYVITALWGI